ncbi:MAG TPA: hypothetical protein VFX61_02925 [Micromonosporaceae bacterium]|nr:hypothetical protein [Micromonosporaceae bacterium]
MAGVLIRMKLILLARSLTGTKAATVSSGAIAGLAAAVGLIWLVSRGAAGTGDLLALALAGWAVSWLAGPLVAGGDPGLRREHLALLPISQRRLAVGLLGAALIGVGPVVTLVAFTALIWYGAGLGVGAALVAVPAALLLLVLLATIANMLIGLLGALVKTRTSAVLSALPWAVVTAGITQVWVLFGKTGDNPWANGLPAALADGARAFPSGWPLVAVEAAGRGDWLLVAAAIAGLAGLAALALAARMRLLDRSVSAPVIRPIGRITPVRHRSPLRAVVGKELRTWSRDLVRLHYLAFAAAYALVYVAMPAAVGITDFLPMTGVFIAVMAAACSAHLYSSDGTALWLTLMLPRSEGADVRGRQLAWLVSVAPLAFGLSVVGLLFTGHWWLGPWVAAALPAVLGGGAGFIVLVSVFAPVRIPDPHRRGANPGEDGGPIGGLVWLMLGLQLLAAAPALAVTLVGTLHGQALLIWAGAPTGLATGALLCWGLGGLAHRRLTARGSELLQRVGTA